MKNYKIIIKKLENEYKIKEERNKILESNLLEFKFFKNRYNELSNLNLELTKKINQLQFDIKKKDTEMEKSNFKTEILTKIHENVNSITKDKLKVEIKYDNEKESHKNTLEELNNLRVDLTNKDKIINFYKNCNNSVKQYNNNTNNNVLSNKVQQIEDIIKINIENKNNILLFEEKLNQIKNLQTKKIQFLEKELILKNTEIEKFISINSQFENDLKFLKVENNNLLEEIDNLKMSEANEICINKELQKNNNSLIESQENELKYILEQKNSELNNYILNNKREFEELSKKYKNVLKELQLKEEIIESVKSNDELEIIKMITNERNSTKLEIENLKKKLQSDEKNEILKNSYQCINEINNLLFTNKKLNLSEILEKIKELISRNEYEELENESLREIIDLIFDEKNESENYTLKHVIEKLKEMIEEVKILNKKLYNRDNKIKILEEVVSRYKEWTKKYVTESKK